jgi:hypothetical protein
MKGWEMRKKGTLALAMRLIAALVGATIGVSADASGGGAVAAKKKKKKKKCPPGTHKVVKIIKKNGKKKKKIKCVPNVTTTTPGPTPSPLVRATLTWTGGGGTTDYDLYAFLGTTTARAASNPIPSTSFSGGTPGASGSETFTDLIFVNPGARSFDFGVCKQDGGNDGSEYSIDYVTADGVHHTDSHAGAGDGYAAKYSGPPPPNAPNGFAPCPVP